MENLFNKFIIKYFDNGKKLDFVSSKLSFSTPKTFTRLISWYMGLFFLYFISVGFALDYKSTFYINLLFFLSFIPIVLSIIYTIFFFTRNNIIPIYRGIFYAFMYLTGIPTIYILTSNGLIYEYYAYYMFYLFFVFLFLSLVPYIEDALLNLKTIRSIIWMFLKGFFIKLDSHNTEDIVNKMRIGKKVDKKEVKEYLYKLKNEFKSYLIVLAIYTSINLIFGVSIYGMYLKYILPIKIAIEGNIDVLSKTSKGLSTFFNISYITVVLGIFTGIAFLIVYLFFLYLKIHFFDLVYKKIKK